MNFWGLGRSRKKIQKTLQSVLDTIKRKKYNTASRTFRAEKDIADWKRYIDQALSEPYYNRYELYEMYDKAMYDPQLSAQVETRKTGTKSEAYVLIDANKKTQEESSELIQKVWFQELIDCILDSVYYGFTALEIKKFKEGEIQSIKRISSNHFSPERNALLPNPQQVNSTVPLEEPLTDYLLTFGKEDDLGLLAKASRCTLYKNFSVSDWARHSERFGTPFLTIKTTTTEQKEIDSIEEMAANFGNNGYAILDEHDEVNLLQQSGQKPFEIYAEMIKFQDEQISKLIVGQTGTADQKSYVGAAEVQERILNWYVETDMKLVKNEINQKVLPFLIKQGYKLEGLKFEWQYFLDKSKPKPKKEEAPNPKSELNLLNPFEDFQEGCC